MTLLHVVVGVITKNKKVLISRRPQGVDHAGLWEFPGGKLEAEETPLLALERELKEELGIHVLSATSMFAIKHNYQDKSVLLDVWSVTSFQGEPKALASTELAWVSLDALSDYSFPAANKPILLALMPVPVCEN